ncbi:integrase core domain-containing protein [Gordonia sp. CPCC 205515]|uniref:integrase core domain-containing protein n=1 Tax=Gordonia sp. CPCC 205515 TaxID=3140791 RepID=UPI003AF40645
MGISYIPPGTPWNNGFIESFNNRMRDECLNRNHWVSFATAMGPPGLPRAWDHLGALLRMLCRVWQVKSGAVSLAVGRAFDDQGVGA